MRIIPDNIPVSSNVLACLILITDDEWDEIENAYWEYREGHDYRAIFPAMSFSQYLRVLISLRGN